MAADRFSDFVSGYPADIFQEYQRYAYVPGSGYYGRDLGSGNDRPDELQDYIIKCPDPTPDRGNRNSELYLFPEQISHCL